MGDVPSARNVYALGCVAILSASLIACGGRSGGSLPPVAQSKGTSRSAQSAAPPAYPFVRCVTQANSGAAAPSATFTVDLACTPGAGDKLIAMVYTTGATAPSSAATVTADVPAGFTKVTGTTYSGSLGQAQIAYMTAAGTETSLSISDPQKSAFLWAVTVYDVQNAGAVAAKSVATSVLDPATGAIQPQAPNSLAIGVWSVQNAAAGAPSAPTFAAPPGWTAGADAPQFTALAGAVNNIVQDSASEVLSGTPVFTEQAAFAGGNFAAGDGVAAMILVAPGPGTATPTPAPTVPATPSVLGVNCVTQANSGAAAPSTSFTFNLACTPNPGDVLVAAVYTAGTTAPASAGSVTPDVPPGFAKVVGTTYSGMLGQAQISSKIATGTESSITVTDPQNNAFLWAVTLYDVQVAGPVVGKSVAVSSLSPATGYIQPQTANSLAIGVWSLQNSDPGPPVAPAFTAPSGWSAVSTVPQFTALAGASNNIVQGSAYAVLPGTPVFAEQAVFAGSNLATAAGVAQMIVVAPGAPSPTPSPSPTASPSPTPAPSPTPTPLVRRGFLGAFFRAIGTPAFGVFSASSPNTPPSPYPTPGSVLFGAGGYCDAVAANGYSISSGLAVDPAKLADVVNLGAKWTRSTLSAEQIDQTHFLGPGAWSWATLDASQCAQLRNNVQPVVGLEAGPVIYDAVPNTYSPVEQPIYESAADFGAYCGAVAQHEVQSFPSVTRYSIPGNEVNNPVTTLFGGGTAQVAAYSEACYRAIKAVQPNAFVYGLELDMEYAVNAPAYVQALAGLGCAQGTCYDGIAIHLFLPWPIPSSVTPCFPVPGGNYDIQCVAAIRAAANAPSLHVLISETEYMVPATVPDEPTKAVASVAAMNLFAQDPNIDGALYANVDECSLYPSGTFAGGCLIDTNGNPLPAYAALQALAQAEF